MENSHITTRKRLTYEELNEFTWPFTRYPTSYPNVLCSRGVRYLAERGDAFWLIEAIGIHLSVRDPEQLASCKSQFATLEFWRLKVNEDGSGELTGDSQNLLIASERIGIQFTTFPLKDVAIWAEYSDSYWTLFLPSEF